MRKKTKVIIGLAVASMATLALAACSGSTNRYGDYEKDGYGVRVRFYSNGGAFASTANVDLVDVYKLPESGGIRVIEPGAPERGTKGEKTQIAYTGHFLAGWYATREEHVDAAGVVSYTYSDPWNFETDRLTINPSKTFEKDEAALSLYAVWIPNYTFTFHAQVNGEWQTIGSHEFNFNTDSCTVTVPKWNIEGENATGRMDYYEFPQRESMTFENVYFDREMTRPCGETVPHTGGVDYEHGVAKDSNVDLYTTWQEGSWFKIFTADQFLNNAISAGCYELLTDELDFTEKVWSFALSENPFTGKLISETGCTFKNIDITQNDSQKQFGGLFGQIRAEAEIKNVTFENVTYHLNAATRLQGGSYGVLAGTLSDEATIENVSVAGQLLVGADIVDIYNFENYEVGLLTGNGVTKGIALGGITVDVVKQEYLDTYPVAVAVGENGVLTITKNDNPDEKPEIK